MTNAKELTRLMSDVIRAAAEHRETWLGCKTNGYLTPRAVQISMEVSILDYRKAVSRLFKAILGRNPEQCELEAIDAAFQLKGT